MREWKKKEIMDAVVVVVELKFGYSINEMEFYLNKMKERFSENKRVSRRIVMRVIR